MVPTAEESGARQNLTTVASPSDIAYCRNRAKQRFLNRNVQSKLNYTCMEDIEGTRTKEDGRVEPNDPNAFINIDDMRANPFKLQLVVNDILPKIVKTNKKDQEEVKKSYEVIFTDYRKPKPGLVHSIVTTCADLLRVSLFHKDGLRDVTSDVFASCKAIDSDNLIGPARVTTGNVADTQVDNNNHIHIITDNGMYVQYRECSEEKGPLRFSTTAVDFGYFKHKFNRVVMNMTRKDDGLIVLYDDRRIVAFKVQDLYEHRITAGQPKE